MWSAVATGEADALPGLEGDTALAYPILCRFDRAQGKAVSPRGLIRRRPLVATALQRDLGQ